MTGNRLGTVCIVEESWNYEEQEEAARQFWDGVSGEELDPRRVSRAREGEWRDLGNTRCMSMYPLMNV